MERQEQAPAEPPITHYVGDINDDLLSGLTERHDMLDVFGHIN